MIKSWNNTTFVSTINCSWSQIIINVYVSPRLIKQWVNYEWVESEENGPGLLVLETSWASVVYTRRATVIPSAVIYLPHLPCSVAIATFGRPSSISITLSRCYKAACLILNVTTFLPPTPAFSALNPFNYKDPNPIKRTREDSGQWPRPTLGLLYLSAHVTLLTSSRDDTRQALLRAVRPAAPGDGNFHNEVTAPRDSGGLGSGGDRWRGKGGGVTDDRGTAMTRELLFGHRTPAVAAGRRSWDTERSGVMKELGWWMA